MNNLQLSNDGTSLMLQQPITDSVGTRLLFENERVRVWDLRLAPGEETPFHRHSTDFLYVVIGDGELQTLFPGNTADPPRPMKDGDVRFREVPSESVHAAKNVGNTPWRNIVVELKRESGRGQSGTQIGQICTD